VTRLREAFWADSGRLLLRFVISESDGRWGAAVQVPGTAVPATAGSVSLASVSCASAGNCSAGGSYETGEGGPLAFVVSQRDGRWGTALKVPDTARLNVGGIAGGTAQPSSISCASRGKCTVGGTYSTGVGQSYLFQAFVESRT
jgi:hypothetical protein